MEPHPLSLYIYTCICIPIDAWFASKSDINVFHSFQVNVYYIPEGSSGNESVIATLTESISSSPFSIACTKRSKTEPTRLKKYNRKNRDGRNSFDAITEEGEVTFSPSISSISTTSSIVESVSSYSIGTTMPVPMSLEESSINSINTFMELYSYNKKPSILNAAAAPTIPVTPVCTSSKGSTGGSIISTLTAMIRQDSRARNPASNVSITSSTSSDDSAALPRGALKRLRGETDGSSSKRARSVRGRGASKGLDHGGVVDVIGGSLGSTPSTTISTLSSDDSSFTSSMSYLGSSFNPSRGGTDTPDTDYFLMEDPGGILTPNRRDSLVGDHDIPDDLATIWKEERTPGGVTGGENAYFSEHALYTDSECINSWLPFQDSIQDSHSHIFRSSQGVDIPMSTAPGFQPPRTGVTSLPRPSAPSLGRLPHGTIASQSQHGNVAFPIPIHHSSVLDNHQGSEQNCTTIPGDGGDGGKSGKDAGGGYFSSTNLRTYVTSCKNKTFSLPHVFLFIVSLIVCYLVVDKLLHISGSPDDNLFGLTIPSWVLNEFITPECKCASYAALTQFCEKHECSTKLTDSSISLSAADFKDNQVQLALWVVTNKVCLTEACYTTGNSDVCKTIGVTITSGMSIPRDIEPPVTVQAYCTNVNWHPYENDIITSNATASSKPDHVVVKSYLRSA